MEPVTLRTDRLLLRPFADSDADAVYRACQDPEIQFYTPVPKPYRLSDAEEFVGPRSTKGWADERNLTLGAFRADDGTLVGSFTLNRLFTGVYELGYWTAPEQRRRGYSEEAARALCAWGFAELGAHRLEWWAMVGNTGSRALAEKLGFVLEGTLLRRDIVDGEPRDWWVGGLLRA